MPTGRLAGYLQQVVHDY